MDNIVIPEWVANYNRPKQDATPKTAKESSSEDFDEVFRKELRKVHEEILALTQPH